MIYFPTNWGAKEPYSLPNDRVENHFPLFVGHKDAAIWHERGCEAPRDFGGSKKIMGKSRGKGLGDELVGLKGFLGGCSRVSGVTGEA